MAVIGGGPAGAAVALALINRGYSTVVIERSDYRGTRAGETLPPAVQPLLVSLGIWDRFLADKHSGSFGIRSAWGQDDLYDNDFIFNPYGAGWHVDRTRFDAMLARCAEDAGATVYRDARLLSCENFNARNWKLEIACDDWKHRFNAKFLVDATGRASHAARKHGARRITWDCLIGVVSFYSLTSPASELDSSTLIEAVEDGWWYSAALPDSRIVVVYMTDADLFAKTSKRTPNYWQQQRRNAPHTHARIGSRALESGPFIFAANSSRLDRAAGKNWLAIGDAAMAFDPLSSQGVYKALETGLLGAEAVRDRLSGHAEALLKYTAQVKEHFDRYLVIRAYYYGQERRWADSLFWNRRHASASSIK